MKKILAFSESNHRSSINHQLVKYSTSLKTDTEVTLLDIRSCDLPIYSIDMDPDQTQEEIKELIALIGDHDGIILSSPEHNGSTPAFLKNILDWLSRRSKNLFENKEMLLMSSSPGKNGGQNNRKMLEKLLPFTGVHIAATFSLPSFHQQMQNETLSGGMLHELQTAIDLFQHAVNN